MHTLLYSVNLNGTNYLADLNVEGRTLEQRLGCRERNTERSGSTRARNFVTGYVAVKFSRRTLLHKVT
jgi:hypothetical protein